MYMSTRLHVYICNIFIICMYVCMYVCMYICIYNINIHRSDERETFKRDVTQDLASASGLPAANFRIKALSPVRSLLALLVKKYKF